MLNKGLVKFDLSSSIDYDKLYADLRELVCNAIDRYNADMPKLCIDVDDVGNIYYVNSFCTCLAIDVKRCLQSLPFYVPDYMVEVK